MEQTIRRKRMRTKYFLNMLYDILNYSHKLQIATLTVDENSNTLKIELISGEKYQLTLNPITEQI